MGETIIVSYAAEAAEVKQYYKNHGITMLIRQPILQTLRIQQWAKNCLVFAALIFANRVQNIDDWIGAVIAFFAFSFIASSIYIFNDIRDISQDRQHPVKKHRPIAAGIITVKNAVIEMIAVFAIGVVLSFYLGCGFAVVTASYVLLQLLYNLKLKHHMITDVICIALGFVLRAIAGAVAIDAAISPWLVICTFSICMFVGFCKRFCEIKTFSDVQADMKNHRKTLVCYTPEFLTHLITISASVAIVSFMLYATSSRTVSLVGGNHFIYTLPLIFYGVCRMAMLSMQGSYGDPTSMIIKDKPLLFTIILWILVSILIVSYGLNFCDIS